MFVAIEGINGCGKSTVVQALASIPPFQEFGTTFEPTQGEIGLYIRKRLREEGLAFNREPEAALLFAADRVLHQARLREMLNEYNHVLCDRYVGTSLAYQGRDMPGGTRWKTVLEMNAVKLMLPDLTIVLDVSPETALARIRGRGPGYIRASEESLLAELRALRVQFLALEGLTALLPTRVISAMGEPQEVIEGVLSLVRGVR